MAFDLHTVEVKDGSDLNDSDRLGLYMLSGVATAAGGGAGTAVTTAVSVSLPATYHVFATSNLAVTINVTSKTQSGFNVVITPVLAATTLGAGTLDILVVY